MQTKPAWHPGSAPVPLVRFRGGIWAMELGIAAKPRPGSLVLDWPAPIGKRLA